MFQVLAYVGIGLVALVVLVSGAAYLLPRHVDVSRAIRIEAPRSEVFPYVNSLKKFNEWSPWYKRDPDADYEFSGPESGKGAEMRWEGDDSVGSGRQTIVESEPPSRVETELDFGEQGTGDAYFELDDLDEEATRVTWGMSADMGNNPIGRWMGLMMDSLIGSDYEKGLSNLKEVVESRDD